MLLAEYARTQDQTTGEEKTSLEPGKVQIQIAF